MHVVMFIEAWGAIAASVLFTARFISDFVLSVEKIQLLDSFWILWRLLF